METNEIFAFVVVGAIFIAAAIPLGVSFCRAKAKVLGRETPQKSLIPHSEREQLYTKIYKGQNAFFYFSGLGTFIVASNSLSKPIFLRTFCV